MPKKRNRLTVILPLILILAGIVVLIIGIQRSTVPIPAPLLPQESITLDPNAEPVGPTAAPDKTITFEDGVMAELKIPAISMDVPIQATNEMVYDRAGRSIRLPNALDRAVWWSKGTPLVGGDQGTSIVAGHVYMEQGPGVFENLHKAMPGMYVWTRTNDDPDKWQQWQIISVYQKPRSIFPEEYWKNDGDRQLVMVTCGGTIDSQGFYTHNVFVVAHPVKDEPAR